MVKKYPTKKQILLHIKNKPPPQKLITFTKKWKKKEYTKKWKTKTKPQKQESLCLLVILLFCVNKTLSVSKNEQIPFFIWDNQGWRYESTENTIYGDKENTSILSTLHEIGHALYGASELKACTFSISIFKEVFPKEYARLEWKGHMLIRN